MVVITSNIFFSYLDLEESTELVITRLSARRSDAYAKDIDKEWLLSIHFNSKTRSNESTNKFASDNNWNCRKSG